MSIMNNSITNRGFAIKTFKDRYDVECNIQKSSIATEDCIWLGVNNADPKIMANDAKVLGIDTEQSTGWVDYPLPREVLLNTRMHLTRDQARELSVVLDKFAETGELL